MAFVYDFVLVLFRRITQFVAGEIGRYGVPFFKTASLNRIGKNRPKTEAMWETDEVRELAYCDPHTKSVGRSGSPIGARNVGQNKTGAAFFP